MLGAAGDGRHGAPPGAGKGGRGGSGLIVGGRVSLGVPLLVLAGTAAEARSHDVLGQVLELMLAGQEVRMRVILLDFIGKARWLGRRRRDSSG